MTTRSRRSYRQRLYSSYVSTHVDSTRSTSRRSLDRLAPTFRAILRDHLPRAKDAVILDVGCGHGALVRFLQREGYQNVHGIDLSVEQVALAAELGVGGIERAEAVPYLNDRSATYDLIVLFDVLEHLTKDEVLELLDATARALKAGGKVVVQSVNAYGPFGGLRRYGDFTHELAFTPHSISQVLRATGFQRIQVLEAPPTPHGLRSAFRWLLWQALRPLLVAYLAAELGVWRGHVLSLNLVAVAEKSGD